MILLTGATGFIGTRIQERIGEAGEPLRILTRRSLPPKEGTEYCPGDITSPEHCRRAMRGIRKVIHAAGEKKASGLFDPVNVRGTENLLAAARRQGVERFVHVSSVGVIGADVLSATTYGENSPCRPKDLYEKSKLKAEQLVDEARAEGFPAIILRPANVFGERDPNVTFLNLARFIRKGWFFFPGGENALISAVYVGDVAAACLALSGQTPPRHGVYHLSCDVTLVDFIANLAERMNVAMHCGTFPSVFVPAARGVIRQMARLPLFAESDRFSRVMSLYNRARYESTRLNDDFGFTLPFGWQRGVERMIGYYQGEGFL